MTTRYSIEERRERIAMCERDGIGALCLPLAEVLTLVEAVEAAQVVYREFHDFDRPVYPEETDLRDALSRFDFSRPGKSATEVTTDADTGSSAASEELRAMQERLADKRRGEGVG